MKLNAKYVVFTLIAVASTYVLSTVRCGVECSET